MNTPQAYHPSGHRQIPASYESYHQPVGSLPTHGRAALGVDRLPERVSRAGLNTTFNTIEPTRVGKSQHKIQRKTPRNSSSNRERPRHIHLVVTGAMQKTGGEASDSQRPVTPTLNSITGNRQAGTQSSYGWGGAEEGYGVTTVEDAKAGTEEIDRGTDMLRHADTQRMTVYAVDKTWMQGR